MTTRRRDLGTRGRVLVAAAAVGSAGVLAGWMAVTDHAATASNDAGGGSSGTSGTSLQPGFDDDRTAVPGVPPAPTAAADARTGGS